jgi:hypothetical protein
LSLAICKPVIRVNANVDDLVVGVAANSLHADNRLIFAASIAEKLSGARYYRDERYAQRGDCIYRFNAGRYVRRRGALYHRPSDLAHDLGESPQYSRAAILLSNDFRYFGRDGTAGYKSMFPRLKQAVDRLGRGHRVQHDAQLRKELLKLKKWLWQTTSKNMVGRPTDPASRRSHSRCGSCAVE